MTSGLHRRLLDGSTRQISGSTNNSTVNDQPAGVLNNCPLISTSSDHAITSSTPFTSSGVCQPLATLEPTSSLTSLPTSSSPSIAAVSGGGPSSPMPFSFTQSTSAIRRSSANTFVSFFMNSEKSSLLIFLNFYLFLILISSHKIFDCLQSFILLIMWH